MEPQNMVWLYVGLCIFCSLFPSINGCPTSMSCASQYERQIDVIILADIDGPFENDAGTPKVKKCQKQQLMISDTICMLKGSLHNGPGLPSARVSYIEFDRNEVNTLYAFNNDVNSGSEVTNQQMTAFADFVESRCDQITDADLSVPSKQCNPGQNTKLYDALQVATTEITHRTNALGRDAYIIIFSDCKVTAAEQTKICNNLGSSLTSNSIKVIMMNIGHEFESNAGDYILCLADDDTSRIYQSQSRDYVSFVDLGLEKTIVNEVCSGTAGASSGYSHFNNYEMDELLNNHDDNMFNYQLMAMNACISAITCMIVIGVCLCAYYFMKQIQSKKYVHV